MVGCQAELHESEIESENAAAEVSNSLSSSFRLVEFGTVGLLAKHWRLEEQASLWGQTELWREFEDSKSNFQHSTGWLPSVCHVTESLVC